MQDTIGKHETAHHIALVEVSKASVDSWRARLSRWFLVSISANSHSRLRTLTATTARLVAGVTPEQYDIASLYGICAYTRSGRRHG